MESFNENMHERKAKYRSIERTQAMRQRRRMEEWVLGKWSKVYKEDLESFIIVVYGQRKRIENVCMLVAEGNKYM